jgi:RNA polymerase sigma-70 factor (ECF subfamily)
MARQEHDAAQAGCGGGRFVTTRWSLVLAAGARTSAESRKALETLCRLYWYPLYAYVRRRGYDADESQDLTQGFFARLIEKHAVQAADPHRGRFRSYLLACLKHFLANEWDRAGAQKRGGGRTVISLDVRDAEGRYRLEPADELTAERLFERRWALTLLEMVLAELWRQYQRDGRQRLFDRLKGFLGGGPAGGPYSRVAEELGMTEAAVKVAVHRLRRRYRELLREHIARTVASPEDVDDEVRQLFVAIGT